MSTINIADGEECLRAIAAMDPRATQMTEGDLRSTAETYEAMADRKQALAGTRWQSGKRHARAVKAEEDADRLKTYAQLLEVAADELKLRSAKTVGAALKPVSIFSRLRGRIGWSR